MHRLTRARPALLSALALRTVARTVPLAVVAVAVLAVAPAIVVAASGRHGFAGALSAASVLAGAGVGYAADDEAAPTLAPSPTTLVVRRALRVIVMVIMLVAAWLAALLIAYRYANGAPDVPALAAELCATAALSAAFACRARTDAPVATGFGAAIAALIAMVTVSSFAYRWSALPALGRRTVHDRWWLVAAAGFIVAAWWSRDPAGRRLTRRRRSPS